MKKTLASILFCTSLVSGRAILTPMESTPTSEVFYQASHKIVVQATKTHAENVYSKEFGFASATKLVVKDVDGREFLYVNMKGDGDCCFHSLGISRDEMLNRLEAYITANEAAFRTVFEKRLQDYEKISSYLMAYREMAEQKEVATFKRADFLDKTAAMKKYVTDHLTGEHTALEELITSTWEILINAQFEKVIDWDIILVQINELLGAFQTANRELIRVKTYREFLQSCEADFWKEVGSDTLLVKISQFMQITDHKTLKDGDGKPLKLMNLMGEITIDDITPYLDALNQYLNASVLERPKVGTGLKGASPHTVAPDRKKKSKRVKALAAKAASKKLAAISAGAAAKTVVTPKPVKLLSGQVESINAKLQFTNASLEKKLKILRRFYGTYESGGRRIWLDSSAIAPIADQLGLKLKVYKLEQDKQLRFTGRYYVVASSPNAEEKGGPALRRIYHRGGGQSRGHYDMLVPLIPGF